MTRDERQKQADRIIQKLRILGFVSTEDNQDNSQTQTLSHQTDEEEHRAISLRTS